MGTSTVWCPQGRLLATHSPGRSTCLTLTCPARSPSLSHLSSVLATAPPLSPRPGARLDWAFAMTLDLLSLVSSTETGAANCCPEPELWTTRSMLPLPALPETLKLAMLLGVILLLSMRGEKLLLRLRRVKR